MFDKTEVDLALCRVGEFVDWSDEEKNEEIMDREICLEHYNEFRHWTDSKYGHWVRKRVSGIRYKACSVPDGIGPVHEPIIDNLMELERGEAEYVLKKLGVLLPIGLRKLLTKQKIL